MEVIKKNIVLFSVLAVAIIISGALFFFVINKKDEYDQSKDKLEDLMKKVKKLNQETPAPVEENLDNIKADIALLDGKLGKLNKIFGNPYRNPIRRFASVILDIKDENGGFDSDVAYDELKKRWAVFWRKEARKEISKEKLLKKFLEELKMKDDSGKRVPVPVDRRKQAWDEYVKLLEKETVEPIHEDSEREILLEGLRLPRQMRNISCIEFMNDLSIALNKTLRKDAEVQVSDSAKYFTFDNYLEGGGQMPLKENIPFIVRHWKMIEDLVKRLKMARVNNKGNEFKFDSISRVNELMGTKQGKDFLVFKYSIELIGDLNVIRSFINNMQDAYKDNRVYVVKNVKLVKQVDNAKKIRDGSDRMYLDNNEKKKFDYRQMQESAVDKAEFERKMKELKKVVIGFNNLVKATIEFDYVIYIGDELKLVH